MRAEAGSERYFPLGQASHEVAPREDRYLPIPQTVHEHWPVDTWNSPAWQGSHVEEPGLEEIEPASQLTQEDAPMDEYVPHGQSSHGEALVADTSFFPDSQAVHDGDPSELAYSPDAHEMHDAAMVPEYLPLGQFVQPFVTPTSWYVPGEQSLQSDESSWSAADVPMAYFPASQSRQDACPTEGWYFPFSHSVHEAALAELFLPASHAVQELWPDAEKLPAAQSSHDVARELEYLPASHVMSQSEAES